MQKRKQQRGMTLLEIMLVLVIGASVALFGIRQYEIFRADVDVQGVADRVNELFEGAALYYRAQCYQGQALDPLVNKSLPNVIPLDIKKDLIKDGYLSSSFPRTNILVDSSAAYNGYSVELIKFLKVRNVDSCSNPPTCDKTKSLQVGTMIYFQIQVAVKLNKTDATSLQNMQRLLVADCLTTASGTPAASTLCSTSPTGKYLGFVRLPKNASSHGVEMTPYWQTLPVVDMFQQNENEPSFNTLVTEDHTTETHYYYCSS